MYDCPAQHASFAHKFTGKERDSESNLDNFGARFDTSSMARFMSPDEFYKDSDVRDPQSWNKYAYVRNNPLRFTDPNGETATVNSSCSTDQNNKTTCNVTVTASIAIYAVPGSGITQDQMNNAAASIQSQIDAAWSGSFSSGGVTYNVSTNVSVEVSDSQSDAMNSGAQNVIAMKNGAVDSSTDSEVDFHKSGQKIDTGMWNINSLSQGVAIHEFTHLLGVGDRSSGQDVSNTFFAWSPLSPPHASSNDFRWALRDTINQVNRTLSCGECNIALPNPFQVNESVSAPYRFWWEK